jgi:hypothetical protein
VRVSGAGASVTNRGSIFSPATSTGIRGFDAAGVDLADGGTVVNDPSGNVRATWKGVEIGAVGTSIGGTLLNQGAIDASNSGGSTGAAVWIHGPGLISNAATGTIDGGPYGIVAYYQTTVVNLGSIGGTKYAFDAANPGFADRVIAAPDATFSGLVSGGNTIGASVVSTLELASGASAGTLNGLGSKYVGFASVTIDVGAIWTWVSDAIGAGYTIADGGTLTNTGRLGSSVTLGTGAVLTNAATGTISGGTTAPGVYATAAATVVNAGSIGGTPDAVKFAAGATDLLVIDPGARFTGIVDGGNTIGATSVSTLELASGASSGTLTGLGAKYIGFGNITVDVGASWTLRSDAIASGYRITDSGTLTNTGSLGSPLTLGVGAVLTNASGGMITNTGSAAVYGSNGGPSTLVNAGSIGNSQYYGVSFAAGGTVTNASGGTITGAEMGVLISSAAGTVVNDGSIAGGASAGVELNEGGKVTNQSGGTITGTSFAVGVGICRHGHQCRKYRRQLSVCHSPGQWRRGH